MGETGQEKSRTQCVSEKECVQVNELVRGGGVKSLCSSVINLGALCGGER